MKRPSRPSRPNPDRGPRRLIRSSTRRHQMIRTAAARRVLTKAATDALRFASLPNDAAPSSQARAEANRTTDDLRACVTLSESLENFASQKLAQRAAAGARCASTKAPPERRRRVYRCLLEHPPQQASDEVNGAAGAALELAKRFDDARGWDRLRALDERRRGRAARQSTWFISVEAPAGEFGRRRRGHIFCGGRESGAARHYSRLGEQWCLRI